MQENWYESDTGREDGWYAPAAHAAQPNAPTAPRRRRRWPVVCGIALLVLALIVGSCFMFRGNNPSERPLPTMPFVGNNTPAEGPNSGGQEEYAEDFRDYFNGFYTDLEKAEDCYIPRVSAYESVSIQLQPQGTEMLSYQDIYKKCAPSVVAIHAYVDPDNEDSYYWGTGIIMSSDGYIVTNAHIIEGTSRATITLWNDAVYEALLVGYDSRSDIAVLKIDAQDLPAAEFCVSDSLQTGDTVIAIGNPLSEQFRSTMTEGIVSGIDRDISYNGATLTLIQTSAPLNNGNSGGPLINIYGQVVGITNMKMSSTYYGSASIEGVGFAIPSQTVKAMADALLSQGQVTGRPALGITVGAIAETAREHYGLPVGLYITKVSEGSDCEAKGILAGDILTAVNGQTVDATSQVLEQVNRLGVGDTLVLTIYRNGETFDVTVSLVDVNDIY